LTAAELERIFSRETTAGGVGNGDRIYAVGAIGVVVDCQARTVLIGRSGSSCVTQWSIGVGNCHGIFLLVKVATSNVDTHIAAAAIARSAHRGSVGASVVVDPVIVAGLNNASRGNGSTEHEAVIQTRVGGSVCDGGCVVLLVARACSHVDANVAACAIARTAHLG
jgi:hypothetical protein